MSWPVYPTGFLSSRGDEDSYKIERSLRFNSADSAYLNRTPASAGNRKTWTWSGWVKFCKDSASRNDTLMCTDPSGTGAGNSFTLLYKAEFSASYPDCIGIYDYAGATANCNVVAKPLIRDYSSWYHVVFSCDTTQSTDTNRVKIYFNGVQQDVVRGSGASAIYPSQNFEFYLNNTYEHTIGAYQSNSFASYRSNFYLAEVNFIDGQALTPSSFGETDAITGRWKAKAFSGTYGTNGFYLNFSDNSSLTTTSNVGIGKDFSGNGNYWATNGLSVTAGADNDSLLDSPTNSGTSGNYCTLNPLGPKVGLEPTASGYGIAGAKDGNLVAYAQAGGSSLWISATQYLNSGKWYWEQTLNDATHAHDGVGIKESDIYQNSTNYYWLQTITGFFVFKNNGDKKTGSTTTSFYGSSLSAGNVVGVAFDADNSKLWFSVNGTWVASGDPAGGTNAAFTSSDGLTTSKSYVPVLACRGNQTAGNNVWACNFGQRPFAYTAPAGFKALCTTNLPTPIIQKPSKYMDVVTYTGTGSALTPTSSLEFSPDLVWIKGRSGATDHALYDSVRGAEKRLESNNTDAEVTSDGGVTSFDSNGFALGTLAQVNTNTSTYVAWAWDEAPIAGMDIVSYTGNGTNRTIAHNIGVAPKMIIVKGRDSTPDHWYTYHSASGATNYLRLNTTDAQAASSVVWNNTAPTSSVFSIGTDSGVNQNTKLFIAYLFAEVEGFSKFGSYTGNGSSDGPFVWCGFRPKIIWIKYYSAGVEGWYCYDTSRDTYNLCFKDFQLNQNYAENATGANELDILSNGIKIRGSDASVNTNGGGYIFAAFAESAFKYARAR